MWLLSLPNSRDFYKELSLSNEDVYAKINYFDKALVEFASGFQEWEVAVSHARDELLSWHYYTNFLYNSKFHSFFWEVGNSLMFL